MTRRQKTILMHFKANFFALSSTGGNSLNSPPLSTRPAAYSHGYSYGPTGLFNFYQNFKLGRSQSKLHDVLTIAKGSTYLGRDSEIYTRLRKKNNPYLDHFAFSKDEVKELLGHYKVGEAKTRLCEEWFVKIIVDVC